MIATKVHVVGADRLITGIFLNKGYEIMMEQEKADIVVFPGGADLAPEMYGEGYGGRRLYVNKAEDSRDKNAWSKLRDHQFRVGICRGGQFLNVMNGGKMYQHVSNHTRDHYVYDCVFNGVEPIKVTSTHHQMMIPTKEAEVLAYAEGIGEDFWTGAGMQSKPIFESEVLWYEKSKSLCFQPHPEMTVQGTRLGQTDQCRKFFFDLIEVLR
jgi:hypothetical protein